MKKTDYIWKNGEIVGWEQANTHILSHGLHYGSAVFEGIRCYDTSKGPAIFELQAHIKRLIYSAEKIGMRVPYSFEELCEAVVKLVRANKCREAYIRPLIYYGYGGMKVTPSDDTPVEVAIACWPWGDYLPGKEIDVMTSSYIRIHPKSTHAAAKISGHYVNSILAGLEIKNTHYHEALLLDADGYVAEGSAENIFIVHGDTIITPPKGTILVGITRNTVLKIANKIGLKMVERKFTVDEIYSSDEAFFCGTAVEVVAIRSLDDCIIGKGEMGSITKRVFDEYSKIVTGKNAAFIQSLTHTDVEGGV